MDLAADVLISALDVTSCPFTVLGDSVAPAFAVARLARDMALMVLPSAPALLAAGVVRTMARADGEVVLRAAVSAEDVLGRLDVQFLQGHRLGQRHLDMQAVMAAV